MALSGLNAGSLALLRHMGGDGWGAGAWVIGIIGFIVMVTLVVLVIWLLVRTLSHHHVEGPPGAYPLPPMGDAIDIAKRRYAAGEITRDQLEEIQKTLKGE